MSTEVAWVLIVFIICLTVVAVTFLNSYQQIAVGRMLHDLESALSKLTDKLEFVDRIEAQE